jgi:hypothetical protein
MLDARDDCVLLDIPLKMSILLTAHVCLVMASADLVLINLFSNNICWAKQISDLM